MRRLMLLRHAKSDWSVGGQRDHERRLAARGREAAPLVGAYMAQHGLLPDRALVSSARRARETWELVARELGREIDVLHDERLYEAAGKALMQPIREVPPTFHSVVLVGHNPGLQELARALIASGDVDARQRLLEKFPTAALAVIDFPVDAWGMLQPHSGRLDRFVTPRALRAETD